MINAVWETIPPRIIGHEWSIRNDIPSVIGSNSINVGGDIYIIGGSDSNTAYKFNISTGANELIAPIPHYRTNKQLAYHGGKIYAIGGNVSNAIYANNQIYDIATNTWTQGTPIPLQRNMAACLVKNDKIYVICGASGPNLHSNINSVYDISTDSWTTLAPAPYGGQMGTYVVVDNTLHIIGLYTGTGSTNNIHMIYNIEYDSWSIGTPLPSSRIYSVGCLFRKEIWVIAGINSDKVTVYNPVSGEWREEDPLPAVDTIIQRAMDIDNNYIYALSSTVAGKAYFYHPI